MRTYTQARLLFLYSDLQTFVDAQGALLVMGSALVVMWIELLVIWIDLLVI